MADSQTFRAITIRRAVWQDYDGVADIWHASASLSGVGPPQMPTLPELRSRVDAEVAAGWTLWVAEDAAQLVGILAIRPDEQVLDQLFVSPGQIGSGVGQQLMDHAKTAMPHGFSLHTAATNARARRFYERAGMGLSHRGAHPRTGHAVVWYAWTPDR